MAPLEVFSNQAQTVVSSGGTTAPSGGTVETWTVSTPGAFAGISAGATVFHVVDANPTYSSEIIAVTATSGTSWTVTRGAASTSPVAHQGDFSVVQVVTAGALQAMQYEPWQFPVEAYGAVGDAKIGTGGTGSSGSHTFTDSGASFVNAAAPVGDVGKYIIVNQGTSGSGTADGTTQAPFVGTIAAVNSATSVNLSANLAAPCASAPYVFGTDDAPAIVAAVNAATTWAEGTSGSYHPQVIFGSKGYMLGTLTQVSSGNKYNTHIPIPVGSQTGRKLIFDLIGAGDASQTQFWESTVPSLAGTCLISASLPVNQPDATYGQQSVIGAPTGLAVGTFGNTALNIDGITIVTPWNSEQYGVYGYLLSQMSVPSGSYQAFAPVNLGEASIGGPYLGNLPTNGISIGFSFPFYLDNDNLNVGALTVQGANIGLEFGDHFVALKLATVYCNVGVSISNVPGGAEHGAVIGYWSCEASNYCLQSTGNAGGATYPVFIGMMDSESINTAHVDDTESALSGTVYWAGFTTGATVNGAENLIIIDILKHFPGPWSGAPTAPSSGTASTNTQQNTSYRYATVYASASTAISNVYTGRAATGLTATGLAAGANVVVPIRVTPGGYYSVAYTGTLTTNWFLD